SGGKRSLTLAWRSRHQSGMRIQRRDAEIAEGSAELMPRRRRGGMGWETWQSDSEAEARGKKRPSCARIGRLKPAPPRQVTGEKTKTWWGRVSIWTAGAIR